MIRLYDTLSRAKQPLESRPGEKLGIYVCGPTVYDQCHVGHARCYVAFDVVVRHLRDRGHDVVYVRNITDVDDRIINRAAELDEAPLDLSARMAEAFWKDMRALGNLDPDVEPKVSEHISEIVAFIERILAAGIAYRLDGDVYFEVGKYPDYGILSRRNLDDLRAGARVEVDERKRSPLDFALWKAAKPGEPSWESPFGRGRPGWHIECSAMSARYLGERFEIHGGGMDLIFPHHENEVAQSRSVFGKDSFARVFMHNGFINVRTGADTEDEEKMSKSLGNFFTIQDVLGRHEAEALRLFLLGTHYRKPISFEVARDEGGGVRFAGIEEAERRIAYAYTTLARLHEFLGAGKAGGGADGGEVLAPCDQFEEQFGEALDDDFNTSAAVGHLSDLLSLANRLLDQPKAASKAVRRRTLEAARVHLERAGWVLGLLVEDPRVFLERRRVRLCTERKIDPSSVDDLIAQRTAARGAKDFARADSLRDQLSHLGVELMDGPSGTTWRVAEADVQNQPDE